MKITRRGFFGIAALAAIAPFVPTPAAAPLDVIRAAAIDRATYSFWRNQDGPASVDHLRENMRTVYNKCSIGGDYMPSLIGTNSDVYKAYARM